MQSGRKMNVNVNRGHPVVPMPGGDGVRALIRLPPSHADHSPTNHAAAACIHSQLIYESRKTHGGSVSSALDLSDCMVLTELASRTLSPRGEP